MFRACARAGAATMDKISNGPCQNRCLQCRQEATVNRCFPRTETRTVSDASCCLMNVGPMGAAMVESGNKDQEQGAKVEK